MSRFLPFLLLGSLLATPLSADPHPEGFRDHRFNGANNPTTEGGVTRFSIASGECSDIDYGDGRGESDCFNGNVREVLIGPEARLGESVTYSFEVRIPEPIQYYGWNNSYHASQFLGDGWDSRLRIASWEGNQVKNFVHLLKLDARRGLVFHGEICADPDEMQDWVRFSLETRWADDGRGWTRVTCNDRTVYFLEGAPSQTNPHCYVQNECEPGVAKSPSRFLFIVGPVLAGNGRDWERLGRSSQFNEFPGEITVEMRDLEVRRSATLYDDFARENVRALQTRLTELGCNPGPVDGAMGQRTRAATLECRSFGDTVVPDAVNARTVAVWRALYDQVN